MPTQIPPPQPQEIQEMAKQNPAPSPKPVTQQDGQADDQKAQQDGQATQQDGQTAQVGDQPSLTGDAGIPQPSPMQQRALEVDILLQALKRAFGSQVGMGAIFDQAERKIRELRRN